MSICLLILMQIRLVHCPSQSSIHRSAKSKCSTISEMTHNINIVPSLTTFFLTRQTNNSHRR